MPARRTFFALGLITLLFAVAVLAPWLGAVAVALDLLVVAAFLLDRRRAAALQIRAARRWPLLLVQGAQAEIEVRFGAEGAARVVAREALHPAVAAGPLRAELSLRPAAEAVWKYVLVPRRRGEHLLGPLTVRVLGPWALAWAQRDLLPPQLRRVYPQVRWEGRVGQLIMLAHRRELGQSPLRLHGLGTEPYALRDYRPGDPPARIHWKATARHGRAVAREDTWERGMRLVVMLDCARAMASMDGSRSKLDYALAAALVLTRIAASRGDRVTLLAFSDRIERVVRVHSGSRALSRAYGSLFDLEARLSEPAYDLAAETASGLEPRHATLVLLTSVVDLAAAELLREAILGLKRKHRPILVNLEDPELRRLAMGAPGAPEEAFAKVASLGILLANRALASRLRHAGVRVVSASADQLAWEALASYLGPPRPSRAAGGATAAVAGSGWGVADDGGASSAGG